MIYQWCQGNSEEGEVGVDAKANPLWTYLENHPDLLIKMVHHIENTSIAAVCPPIAPCKAQILPGCF